MILPLSSLVQTLDLCYVPCKLVKSCAYCQTFACSVTSPCVRRHPQTAHLDGYHFLPTALPEEHIPDSEKQEYQSLGSIELMHLVCFFFVSEGKRRMMLLIRQLRLIPTHIMSD